MKISDYFHDYEVRCHGEEQGSCGCGGSYPVNERLLQAADDFRWRIGKAVYPTCAYRCHTHNRSLGSQDSSQHTKGLAMDVRLVEGFTIEKMADIALACGFKGIGLYNWGIHLDVRKLTYPTSRPIVWDNRSNS